MSLTPTGALKLREDNHYLDHSSTTFTGPQDQRAEQLTLNDLEVFHCKSALILTIKRTRKAGASLCKFDGWYKGEM